MSLTKTDLVTSIIDKVHLKRRGKSRQIYLFPEMDYIRLEKKRAATLVDCLFNKIKDTLEGGEDVKIKGFGKFQVRFKWARRGRNPQTGEPIMIRPRRTVTFKVSKKLRDHMNSR